MDASPDFTNSRGFDPADQNTEWSLILSSIANARSIPSSVSITS